MKKSKFSDAQILAFLKQAENGVPLGLEASLVPANAKQRRGHDGKKGLPPTRWTNWLATDDGHPRDQRRDEHVGHEIRCHMPAPRSIRSDRGNHQGD